MAVAMALFEWSAKFKALVAGYDVVSLTVVVIIEELNWMCLTEKIVGSGHKPSRTGQ